MCSSFPVINLERQPHRVGDPDGAFDTCLVFLGRGHFASVRHWPHSSINNDQSFAPQCHKFVP